MVGGPINEGSQGFSKKVMCCRYGVRPVPLRRVELIRARCPDLHLIPLDAGLGGVEGCCQGAHVSPIKGLGSWRVQCYRHNVAFHRVTGRGGPFNGCKLERDTGLASLYGVYMRHVNPSPRYQFTLVNLLIMPRRPGAPMPCPSLC